MVVFALTASVPSPIFRPTLRKGNNTFPVSQKSKLFLLTAYLLKLEVKFPSQLIIKSLPFLVFHHVLSGWLLEVGNIASKRCPGIKEIYDNDISDSLKKKN